MEFILMGIWKDIDDTGIIGFTCGTFDLLHPGHVDMLEYCKVRCDKLIVGLHVDPSIERPIKHKPIQTVYERWVQLDACKYVDLIIPYQTEEDLRNILCMNDIDVRFVGNEYMGESITAEDLCLEKGIQIIFNERWHDYSSTELRERIKKNELS